MDQPAREIFGYAGRRLRTVLRPAESFCVVGHGHRIRKNWERGHLGDEQVLDAYQTYKKASTAGALIAFAGIALGSPLMVGGLGVAFALLATRDRRALRPAGEIVTTQEKAFRAARVMRGAESVLQIRASRGDATVLDYWFHSEACFDLRDACGAFLRACQTYSARSPLDRALRVHPTVGGAPPHIEAFASQTRQILQGLRCG